jgi:hypothetical protein
MAIGPSGNEKGSFFSRKDAENGKIKIGALEPRRWCAESPVPPQR